MRRPLTTRKCKHCQTFFAPDPRSARRQRHCSKPECRQASKVASQHRWLHKPGNRDYFTGPTHVERCAFNHKVAENAALWLNP